MIFERMCKAVSTLLPKIIRHEFHQRLIEKTLRKDQFLFFIEQDSLYLPDFVNALQIIARRPTLEVSIAKKLERLAEDVVDYEIKLNQQYLPRSISFFKEKERIPAVSFYAKHILNLARNSSIEEAIAGITPCYWIYRELGKVHRDIIQSDAGHPYHDWVTTYADESFSTSVGEVVSIMRTLGNAAASLTIQEKMISAFVESTKHELNFLDSVLFYKPAQSAQLAGHQLPLQRVA